MQVLILYYCIHLDNILGLGEDSEYKHLPTELISERLYQNIAILKVLFNKGKKTKQKYFSGTIFQ